jgi:membrane peptidoglycan carboxypeptidase
MFESLPVALVPLLSGVHFRGMFSWQGGVQLDTDKILDSTVTWHMQNGCVIDKIPTEIDPKQFAEPFQYTVLDSAGEPMTLVTGPETDGWVPRDEMSSYLEVAVLTTEDGGFWRHRGFDHGAIEGSIKSNLQAGRFVRGASTLSMQLAKNLYLSRDKLLSRKIQEALLTMLLEQELSKDEILELYFNVVELGPDIYGVGAATQYYFNSKPSELSLAQAFFLASILPNPRAQHFETGGALSPVWRETLHRLMRTAEQRKRITAAELEQGLADDVQFGVPNLLPDDGSDDRWTHQVDDPWAQ